MQNEDAGPGAGFVYMQTNEPERNRLLAFRRAGIRPRSVSVPMAPGSS